MKKLLVTQTDLPSKTNYVEYLDQLWETKWITNHGTYVSQLEEKLQSELAVPNVILTNNGTSALQVVLHSLFKPGGEIITTPFTFAATTTSILWEHLIPVFVDVEPDTFNIDPFKVENAITEKTVGIMAVHVYGNPCNVDELERVSNIHNLALIYDAAHAFSVEFKGKPIVQYGDYSVLSFHATKAFHTIEGGAIITADAQNDRSLRPTINFGIVEFEERLISAGINAKMNEFQAAMGLCNLKNFDKYTAKRKKLHSLYVQLLSEMPAIQLQRSIASKENYSYMPVVFESKDNRDRVEKALAHKGIFGRKYFYPLTSSYQFIEKSSKRFPTPIAKKISDGVLCLPLHTAMTSSDVKRVVQVIKSEIQA